MNVIHCTVPPGESSTFWQGERTKRYYNTKKKALRDSDADYYRVGTPFNTRAAVLTFLVLIIIFLMYKL